LGFALASHAAAVTLVLFLLAPSDLESQRSHLHADQLSKAGQFALFVTLYVAQCAAVPALASAIFAEVRGVARWWFYALVGIATAAASFLVLYVSEKPPEGTSFLTGYVLAAFLTSGLVGGLAYWALSGRFCKPRPNSSSRPPPPDGAPPPGVARSTR
jgi:hypothetical protein